VKSNARLVLAAALAVLGLVSASALATAGTSDTSTTAQTSTAQTSTGRAGKVTICHKGKNTLSVSVNAWPAHKAHGDTLGACATAKQKGPKQHGGTTTTTTTTTTTAAAAPGNGHGNGKNK
jgi:hypothetical protein